MRILLDECVNPRLRLAFPGDSVKTVAEMGWRSLTNGRLMKEAVSLFDVFVTLDQNLRFRIRPVATPWVSLYWSPDSIISPLTDNSLPRFAMLLDERNLGKSTFFKSGRY
jgi:predicted nuclease of predicted toxin-antitoxin system